MRRAPIGLVAVVALIWGAVSLRQHRAGGIPATPVEETARAAARGESPAAREWHGSAPDAVRFDPVKDVAEAEEDSVPLILAGVVVDARGQPVQGAGVGMSSPVFDSAGVLVQWKSGPSVATGPGGRFEFRGQLQAPYVRLDCGHRMRHGTLFRVAVGSEDVVLQLSAHGRIVAESLLDPAMKTFRLGFNSRAEDGQFHDWRSQLELRNGEVQSQEIPAGLYDLAVFDSRLDRPLLEIDGVQVVDGEETSDSRLHPLDLRLHLRKCTVHVVDESDQLLRDSYAAVRVRGEQDAPEKWIHLNEGTLDLWSGGDVYDVRFEARDRNSQTLEDVRGELRVHPELGQRIRLRLPPDQRLQPPLRMMASVVTADRATIELYRDPRTYFDELGEWRGYSRFAGTVKIVPWLALVQPNRIQRHEIRLFKPIEIEVLAGRGEQIFEISIDPKAVEAAALELEVRDTK